MKVKVPSSLGVFHECMSSIKDILFELDGISKSVESVALKFKPREPYVPPPREPSPPPRNYYPPHSIAFENNSNYNSGSNLKSALRPQSSPPRTGFNKQ